VVDVSSELKLTYVIGPNAKQALKSAQLIAPETTHGVCSTEDYCLIKIYGKQDRFILISSFEKFSSVSHNLQGHSCVGNFNDFREDNIIAEIPLIYPQTQESFTPHMVNLDKLDGISFTKGCYLGQEIVARTQFLGKLKRHLYPLTLTSDDSVQPGTALYDSEQHQVGTIIDANPLAEKSIACLAVIQDKAMGQKLTPADSSKGKIEKK